MKCETKEIMAGMPENAKVEIIEKLTAKDFFVKYGYDKIICTTAHRQRVFIGFHIMELLRNGKSYSPITFFEEDYRPALGSFVIDGDDVGGDDALFEDGVVYVVRVHF